jgi:hypothetical protein
MNCTPGRCWGTVGCRLLTSCDDGERTSLLDVARGKVKKGQTYAVTALSRCLTHYGRDSLITALQCITQTADGNAGFVRSTIIAALCEVLHHAPGARQANSYSERWTSLGSPINGIKLPRAGTKYFLLPRAK